LVYKDPDKGGLTIHSNKRSRRNKSFRDNNSFFVVMDKDWVSFDREIDYDGLKYEIDGEEIVSEDIRSIIEKKIFEETLDENGLRGLLQEDVTIKYEKGKIPMLMEIFVDMIIKCPVIEDEIEDF
jgi:hypothetical protein